MGLWVVGLSVWVGLRVVGLFVVGLLVVGAMVGVPVVGAAVVGERVVGDSVVGLAVGAQELKENPTFVALNRGPGPTAETTCGLLKVVRYMEDGPVTVTVQSAVDAPTSVK